MNDNEILQHLKDEAREDLDFYSNLGKEKRERWVVSEFLRVIKHPFKETEIKSLEQSSKVDVRFVDANFQIKEITNPNTLRGKRVKDTYNSIKSIQSLNDLQLPSIVEDVPAVAKIYDLIVTQTETLSDIGKYEKSKKELDLIFYITRTRASLIEEEEINTSDFSGLGWRSVICLNGRQAVVLYASEEAPRYIQACSGRVIDIDNH
ncbi:MAG: DUF1780 domain-containing protein [Paraglaciecola sp.]|uniref:DUF1780 domain-containing protein n=1 Tax=Paraglaciecola sp. TaxID=1920173 RepID=UPI0032972871